MPDLHQPVDPPAAPGRAEPGRAEPGRAEPRRRDRHGRGLRGAMSLPGPYSPARPPIEAGRAARFDDLVLDCVEQLERTAGDRLDDIEFAVEDVPGFLPDDPDDLRLVATVVTARPPGPADPPAWRLGQPKPAPAGGGEGRRRVVVYRRPVELRARSRAEVTQLVLDLLVEEVARLLDVAPEEIDPRPE